MFSNPHSHLAEPAKAGLDAAPSRAGSASLPGWPIGLGWEAALAYSGVSPDCLEAWMASGLVTFGPFGPERGMICQRTELERALELAFAASHGAAPTIIEDFDFDD